MTAVPSVPVPDLPEWKIAANLHYADWREGGLCLFCPACSLMIRLHHSLRFPLVAL